MLQRILVVLAAIFVLGMGAACTTTQPLPPGHADAGITLVGSIAPLDSFEWEVAPMYTRLAVLRQRTARLLRDSRIDIAAAVRVQQYADHARGLLDQAVAAELKSKDRNAARATASQAKADIDSIESILQP